jgi:hypothetical protein
MSERRNPTDSATERPLLPSDHAFVVQFQAGEGHGRVARAGRIEHLSSGQATHFALPEEMLSFARRVLAQLGTAEATRRGATIRQRLGRDRAQKKGEKRR